jgi:hypothetical protein
MFEEAKCLSSSSDVLPIPKLGKTLKYWRLHIKRNLNLESEEKRRKMREEEIINR